MARKIFTDLDQHASVPLRVQPLVGEWGPQQVLSTRRKKRSRVIWAVVSVVLVAALLTVGWYVFTLINNAG
jgi:hypothetical protein